MEFVIKCENISYAGHLKLNTIHLPVVHGLEDDFAPVFGLCTQIADFLEKVLEMSWANRRIVFKEELAAKAKQYAHRVDDVSCQVMIQLKLRTSPSRFGGRGGTALQGSRNGSMDSDDSSVAESENGVMDTIAFDARGRPYRPSKANTLRRVCSVVFIATFIVGVFWIILLT